MANPEHVAILRQGVEVWNQWRKDNLDIRPDLHMADFTGADLTGANFYCVEWGRGKLSHAHLRECVFAASNLFAVDFGWSNLTGANLSKADLSLAHMNDCVLSGVNVYGTVFYLTGLRNADLSQSSLNHAIFDHTILDGTDFSQTTSATNVFSNVDLSTAKGLETMKHVETSSIGIDTLLKSRGKIPDVFLRGCGVPEKLIAALPSLLE